MCLLYSEPGAGSDLASVQTRAERDGDEWVVNGQKVWTSGGRHAHYGLLIARTDWDAPKHRGISFFFLPMRQAGVEVRPLRQATGDARFNEVFLTDARVPDAYRLGEVNGGWWVLQTALMYERAAMGVARRRQAARRAASPAGAERRVRGTRPDAGPVPRGARPGRRPQRRCPRPPGDRPPPLPAHGQRVERAAGPRRDGAGLLLTGGVAGQAGHVGHRPHRRPPAGRRSSAPRRRWPAPATRWRPSAPTALLNAYFTSIGGGTDQIQRNIIGERILGLPREPEVDKALPFREVRKSPAVATDEPAALHTRHTWS